MRKLLLVSSALLLGAWTWNSITWGNNTQYITGQPCISLSADGGFVDGGGLLDSGVFLFFDAGIQLFDAGIQDTDAGVCADGGLQCQSCSGTCNLDSGILDPADAGILNPADAGPQYTVQQDGGWNAGAPQLFTSDYVPANTVNNCSCHTVGSPGIVSPLNSQIELQMEMIGTSDKVPQVDGGIWGIYSSGTQTCRNPFDAGLPLQGGQCQIVMSQVNPLANSALQEVTNNSDGGGLACCICATQ